MARRTWNRELALRSPPVNFVSSHHSVLAHQDNTLSAEGASDFMHLLGADIIDTDDEDRFVLLQQALELIEVAGLVC